MAGRTETSVRIFSGHVLVIDPLDKDPRSKSVEIVIGHGIDRIFLQLSPSDADRLASVLSDHAARLRAEVG